MVGIDEDYRHSRLFGNLHGDNTHQLQRQRGQSADYFNGMPDAAVLMVGIDEYYGQGG
jgi:hypothetical protein